MSTPDPAPDVRIGETVVALSPFIAVALFFLSWHTWLVFLLIPAASVLIYGGSHGRRNRG